MELTVCSMILSLPALILIKKTECLFYACARAFRDMQKNQAVFSQIHLRAYRLISEDNTGAAIVVERHRGQC